MKSQVKIKSLAFSCGSYGNYYKQGKKGYKVLHKGPTSEDDLILEFEQLKYFNEIMPGVFPKPYRIVTVEVKDFTYNPYKVTTEKRQAIEMQHIDGRLLNSFSEEKQEQLMDEKVEPLICKLLENKLFWNDCHGNNVIITKDGKARLLDADPSRFRTVEE